MKRQPSIFQPFLTVEIRRKMKARAQTFAKWARAALFALVCLCSERGGAGELAALDEDLVAYELSWMPWKTFNYSVPSAVEYCPHQHCMRCSAPFEMDPHPYLPCRAIPAGDTGSSGAGDSVLLEVASSHLPFGAVLRERSCGAL